ncbi:ABC transporter permease subunit [Bacillus sp. SCS-153A]|uniref:ABC transporter permease subunit n=1 Tax=Rossellomorea sedimentorum TaxID=3115294 RepID=UPI003905D869
MLYRSLSGMVLKFLFVSLGIVMISGIIGLFTNGIQISLEGYLKNIWQIILSLSSPSDITITNEDNNTYPMFPTFWSYYFYSMIIFISSILLATVAAFILTFFTIGLPQKASGIMLKVLNFLESLPDLLIIIVIQFFVIVFFKRTGILLAPVAGGNDPVYLLPICALAILPSIFIFRLCLLLVEDELTKPYVDLARSKGFKKMYIFTVHIVRNIMPSMMNHMKAFILILLSNLIVFERLFNIYGITHFIFSFPQIDVIAFSLIMFYLPIFLLLMLSNVIIYLTTGQKVVI